MAEDPDVRPMDDPAPRHVARDEQQPAADAIPSQGTDDLYADISVVQNRHDDEVHGSARDRDGKHAGRDGDGRRERGHRRERSGHDSDHRCRSNQHDGVFVMICALIWTAAEVAARRLAGRYAEGLTSRTLIVPVGHLAHSAVDATKWSHASAE
jgi:hypothetical protein